MRRVFRVLFPDGFDDVVNSEKGRHHLRVEDPPGIFPNIIQGLLFGERLLVGPPGNQGVINVRQDDDAAGQGNLLAFLALTQG